MCADTHLLVFKFYKNINNKILEGVITVKLMYNIIVLIYFKLKYLEKNVCVKIIKKLN